VAPRKSGATPSPARPRRTKLREGRAEALAVVAPTTGESWLGLIARRLLYAIATVVLAFAIYRLQVDPIFQVRRVDVVGARLLDRSAVLAVAAVDGESVFGLRTNSVENRIVGLGVPIRAVVSVRLPDGVAVTIAERSAAYAWRVGSSTYVVSADGIVLAPGRADHLPIVVDDDRQPVAVGDRLDVGVLREAAVVTAAFPAATGLSVSFVTYSKELGIAVTTPSGIEVQLGDDQNLPEKLADVAPLLKVASAEKPLPRVIDLRRVRHPLFRY